MTPDRAHHLVQWLRDRAEDAGAHGFVVGLSGGIDSAVVARLCQMATPNRVLGVILPCYSHVQDESDARLLAKVSDHMQKQREANKQQAGQPRLHFQADECLSFPPQKAQNQKRNEISVLVVRRGFVTEKHPLKKRVRLDISESRVPQKFEQQNPTDQKRDKHPFIGNALPKYWNFAPQLFQKCRTVVLLFCHTPLLGTAVGISPRLQTVPSIVTALQFVTTPFPTNTNNCPTA